MNRLQCEDCRKTLSWSPCISASGAELCDRCHTRRDEKCFQCERTSGLTLWHNGEVICSGCKDSKERAYDSWATSPRG